MYDTIIVGGGPAGLSAALHLAWHKRSVLVVDRRSGPLFYTLSKLENVPGMPAQSGVQIMKSLREQAIAMGAEVLKANVSKLSGELGAFSVETDKEVYQAKTLLLATGVARYHPTVDGDYTQCLRYAGKCNLYYCPDCEAPEIEGKKTLVIGTGSSAGAVATAKHLFEHSKDLSILLTSSQTIKEEHQAWLDAHKIELRQAEIAEFQGHKGCLSAIVLKDGSKLEYEAYFVSSPKIPRSDIAKQLGVQLREKTGHVEPQSQRGDTNIPGVWVAGDLRPMTQQVAIAIGTGNIAAVHIDQVLMTL